MNSFLTRFNDPSCDSVFGRFLNFSESYFSDNGHVAVAMPNYGQTGSGQPVEIRPLGQGPLCRIGSVFLKTITTSLLLAHSASWVLAENPTRRASYCEDHVWQPLDIALFCGTLVWICGLAVKCVFRQQTVLRRQSSSDTQLIEWLQQDQPVIPPKLPLRKFDGMNNLAHFYGLIHKSKKKEDMLAWVTQFRNALYDYVDDPINALSSYQRISLLALVNDNILQLYKSYPREERLPDFGLSLHPNIPSRNHEKARWKACKMKWRQQPQEELRRLKDCLSSDNYHQLRTIAIKGQAITPTHQVLLGHALRIRDLHRETDFTFIHGQRLGFWVFNQFLKEYAKLMSPDRDFRLQHVLRDPLQRERARVIADYRELKGFCDHAMDVRADLLCADGYFFQEFPGESANYFVNGNGNVCTDLHPELKKAIEHRLSLKGHCPSNLSDEIFKKLDAMMSEYQKLDTIGNIYAICIPGHLIKQLMFTSHPGGEVCRHWDLEYEVQVLRHLQCDQASRDLRCDFLKRYYDSHMIYPQYRVGARLGPEVRTYLLTPVRKEIKDEYKQRIKQLARVLYEGAS